MTNVQAGAAPCSSKFVRQPARELAEALTLPPGVHGQIVADDAVPQNVSEARVLHTCLTRSLGRRYRERWGLVLRADRSGIVLAQAGLRARLPVRAITCAEDARIVLEHGAFASEIFARTFGAVWTDIAPRELGAWQMSTAGGATVRPFGQVLGAILERNAAGLIQIYDTLARARAL